MGEPETCCLGEIASNWPASGRGWPNEPKLIDAGADLAAIGPGSVGNAPHEAEPGTMLTQVQPQSVDVAPDWSKHISTKGETILGTTS